MKKLLIWDGDESLWNGTITAGDDIQLPAGRLELCMELRNRGVVQSIASFNLLEDVTRAVHKFGLEDAFLVPQASFGTTKSAMITTIMQVLGISKQSDVVFVDDNVHNIAEVATMMPNVTAIFPPEVDDVVLEYFTKDAYTTEDKDRVRMYRANIARESSGKAYSGDHSDFLRSLNMRATISRPTTEQMPRVIQLVERANRMAAADQPYTADMLQALQDLGNVVVLTAVDDFGDYGLSGVIVRSLESRSIHLMVISCRLQGKGLGSAFLGSVLNGFTGDGDVIALWQETAYNAGIQSLYEWYGFDVDTNQAGLVQATRFMKHSKQVELPNWIEVEYNV